LAATLKAAVALISCDNAALNEGSEAMETRLCVFSRLSRQEKPAKYFCPFSTFFLFGRGCFSHFAFALVAIQASRSSCERIHLSSPPFGSSSHESLLWKGTCVKKEKAISRRAQQNRTFVTLVIQA